MKPSDINASLPVPELVDRNKVYCAGCAKSINLDEAKKSISGWGQCLGKFWCPACIENILCAPKQKAAIALGKVGM